MDFILVILLSYISGSIPFGLMLTKLFSKVDIRKIGSGTIGATNVLRTGNKYLALITLLLDILKGYIPVIITLQHYPELIQLSCLLAFLGHLFPIWLKFKGGKGVATYLGILFALSIQLSFLFIFTWLVVALIFKYSSVSSMFGSLTVFVISVIKDTALKSINANINFDEDIKLILFIFFILIIFTHRNNISNLKNKNEKKIKI
jgi:glycerol-3-phosphate acyltransferase PlsY